MFFQPSHPAGTDAERATYPTPFTWTKGPDQLQRIIEATKEYQAAHPKQPKTAQGQEGSSKELTARCTRVGLADPLPPCPMANLLPIHSIGFSLHAVVTV
jgi:hypothetical protein